MASVAPQVFGPVRRGRRKVRHVMTPHTSRALTISSKPISQPEQAPFLCAIAPIHPLAQPLLARMAPMLRCRPPTMMPKLSVLYGLLGKMAWTGPSSNAACCWRLSSSTGAVCPTFRKTWLGLR